MKNCIYLLIAMASLYTLTMLPSCSKNSEDQFSAGVTAADTTNVKYSTAIVPILSARCYRCHSSKGGGVITLDTYDGLLRWTTNGYLVGTVTHGSGYVGMPYGETKMSANEINQIVAWVHQGAKNN